MSFNYETVKDLIRCPRSMSALVLDGASLVCTDPQCRLQCATRDDLPSLHEDEASELPETDWRGVMARHRRGTASSAPR